MVEVEAADRVHDALLDLGYQCLYRSEDAANYVRAADGQDKKIHRASLDMAELREYFVLFNKPELLNDGTYALFKSTSNRSSCHFGVNLLRSLCNGCNPNRGTPF